MKNRILISSLTIAILAAIASFGGLYPGPEGTWFGSPGSPYQVESIRGEQVMLDGRGLYGMDSISVAAQGRAQDAVTILIGIPLLLISLNLYRKGSARGHILLVGTLAYVLYAYTSYAFLSTYNAFLLIYVALFSLSLFTFIPLILQVDAEALAVKMAKRTPVRLIAADLYFTGVMLLGMWLMRIVPPLFSGGLPVGIETYTTLVIQVLDLGIIVPIAFLTGTLMLRRRAWGFILGAVFLCKGLTMFLAILAMIIGEALAGTLQSSGEVVIFAILVAINLWCAVVLFRAIPASGQITQGQASE